MFIMATSAALAIIPSCSNANFTRHSKYYYRFTTGSNVKFCAASSSVIKFRSISRTKICSLDTAAAALRITRKKAGGPIFSPRSCLVAEWRGNSHRHRQILENAAAAVAGGGSPRNSLDEEKIPETRKSILWRRFTRVCWLLRNFFVWHLLGRTFIDLAMEKMYSNNPWLLPETGLLTWFLNVEINRIFYTGCSLGYSLPESERLLFFSVSKLLQAWLGQNGNLQWYIYNLVVTFFIGGLQNARSSNFGHQLGNPWVTALILICLMGLSVHRFVSERLKDVSDHEILDSTTGLFDLFPNAATDHDGQQLKAEGMYEERIESSEKTERAVQPWRLLFAGYVVVSIIFFITGVTDMFLPISNGTGRSIVLSTSRWLQSITNGLVVSTPFRIMSPIAFALALFSVPTVTGILLDSLMNMLIAVVFPVDAKTLSNSMFQTKDARNVALIIMLQVLSSARYISFYVGAYVAAWIGEPMSEDEHILFAFRGCLLFLVACRVNILLMRLVAAPYLSPFQNDFLNDFSK